MARTTLVFQLTDAQVQQDLLREFALHPEVSAEASVVAGAPVLTVEASSADQSMWEVRATIGMFDDGATEITDQEPPR